MCKYSKYSKMVNIPRNYPQWKVKGHSNDQERPKGLLSPLIDFDYWSLQEIRQDLYQNFVWREKQEKHFHVKFVL